MNRPSKPISGRQTPWGQADSQTIYGPGITFYSTPSHGGFLIDAERLAKVHAKHGPVKTFCGCPEWFEEDCDWAYVATTFPMLFTDYEMDCANATVQWNKDREAAKAGVL